MRAVPPSPAIAGQDNYATPSPPFSSMKRAISSTPLPGAQIGEDEGPRAAHALGLALHGFQRRADIGREIDLVDHQKVGAGDARAALRRDLVAGGDVDDVDGQIGKLRRKRRGEIVAAGFDQHQIERREISAACRRSPRGWPRHPRGSRCAGSRRFRRRRCGRARARRSAPDIRRPIWCRCRW